MAGRLQSSGAISFNDINLKQGVASGTAISMNDSVTRAFGGARTSGTTISMSNMYNRALTLDISVASAFGSGVSTATLTMNNGSYFESSQLPTGSTIKITSLVTAAWVNPPYSVEYTFTMGTASTVQHGGTGGGKNYYIQTIFDGTNVHCYGYYSGSSTNTPYGTVSLTRLSLV
jgi:hypothetical protein